MGRSIRALKEHGMQEALTGFANKTGFFFHSVDVSEEMALHNSHYNQAI